MKIPFHKSILPESWDTIIPESVKSGWLTTGPQVSAFEKRLSEYLNAEHVVAVNSCTAALHLALAANDFGPGDKFIVPTFTFVASVEVGEWLGMQPILVDCEMDGFGLDLSKVEDILKRDQTVKAIIPVHYAGKSIDMKRVFELADKFGVFVLEDAAHALESESNVGKVGSTDHATGFSFYANKNITTGGEGGALATNDGELAEKVRKMSLHGMSKDGWKRFETGGVWGYEILQLGYKYNMTDISASFGLWQFQFLEEWRIKRNEIVSIYQKALSGIDGIKLPIESKDEIHAWHLFVIQIDPAKWQINRDEIICKINKKGIGTSVHYLPIHMHLYYQNTYGFNSDDFPISKRLSVTSISLPLYPSLKHVEVNYIIDTISELWVQFQC